MATHDTEMTLAEARAQLARSSGRTYWRSLEELASSDRFRRMLEREMPRQAAADWDPIDRRDFIRLMGASLALAGLTSCTKQPTEKIVPYVNPPEEVVPGKPLFFATATTLGGYAYPALAESHMGRPTKLEGNPQHAASLGATDIFTQAAILQLYDPDRSQIHLNLGRVATWDAFAREIEQALVPLQLGQGAGLRILTETVTSPTLAAQLGEILERFPQARWHQYEPFNGDHALEGARLAFGEPTGLRYRLDKATVVLSLDGDFLGRGPGHLRYARDFMARRDLTRGVLDMNRLYVVESTPSLTGATADHRLGVRPSQVEHVARALARGLGIDAALGETEPWAEWVEAVVRDLKKHRGSCLVVAGEQQPPVVHALAHAMNDALDAIGHTVILTDPVEAAPVNQAQSIRELAADMAAGSVQLLLIVGGNPAYNAPADTNFAAALQKVKLAVHLSAYEDETSRLCAWHLAEAHSLEAWSDARAYDGAVTILQPLIEPLYGGKSAHEVLSVLQGRSSRTSYEIVQGYWKARANLADFDVQWRRWLHDGWVPGTEAAVKAVALKGGFATTAPAVEALSPRDLEVVFLPDPSVWDGRFANNGWLQELPRPLTKVVWDNVILMAPQTAAYRRLQTGFVVELTVDGRTVGGPVCIMPGHPEDAVTVYAGGGRTAAGRTGNEVGFNAFAIRTSTQPYLARAPRATPARPRRW
jgi:MoCo/4Fe-4S cofactor protein with predicted Tat translocation signal